MRPLGPAVCCAVLILTTCVSGCNQLNAWALNESGKAHYSSGNYIAARDEFRRAAVDDPANVDYLHNVASASQKLGDKSGAEAFYRQALSKDPKHQPSYHGLASTLADQGRMNEAVDLVHSWRSADPSSPQPLIEMAWLQQQMGDITGAEATLRQAVAIRPNHPIALAQLGGLYEDTGRPAQAASLYRQSLAYDWNQPAVMARLNGVKTGVSSQMASSRPVQYVTAPPATWNALNGTGAGKAVENLPPPATPSGPIADRPEITPTGGTFNGGAYQVPPTNPEAPRQMFGPGLEFGPTVVPFENGSAAPIRR
ncbi:tetratricopeptide repeat protein [Stratiformator vulcanicus]|uniref:Outer membrane protein PgaA n=1 Tax=Stratiformator vulcanicus TaxID=2527980 RepID=A0A517QX37_9PLAN|nr:tetratricopeptide repeat protein [Stratiformator vulcanicus]QDT36138.1 outer membrane protein PgaA [Stratiformator vulcanicus]